MAETIFKTYAEAASYAKRRAQQLGSSVRMGRFNEEWVVYDPESPLLSVRYPDYTPSPPPYADPWGPDYWRRREEELAQEKLERELRQREYADQKAYEEAIQANTPRVKESVCEACDRPISRCRCSS